MDGECHAPVVLPLGKTWYQFYRRLGGLQGWSGQVRKILPPPGFDFRTVQPVASHYNDFAIPAQYLVHEFKKNKISLFKLMECVIDNAAVFVGIQMQLQCYVTVIRMT